MNNQTQFKGVWIPDFILELTTSGTISSTDLLLLSVVFSLSKRREGCTAGREYLAQMVGKSEGRVKNRLTQLRKMGLIIDIGFDGRRQAIKTCWDNEPALRQPSRKRYPSRNENVTPENSSSTPSSTRGNENVTAHQAIYNIERVEDRQNSLSLSFNEETEAQRFNAELTDQLINQFLSFESNKTDVIKSSHKCFAWHLKNGKVPYSWKGALYDWLSKEKWQ